MGVYLTWQELRVQENCVSLATKVSCALVSRVSCTLLSSVLF